MNIISLIHVDAYKHVKILNAQPKAFEVCANICNLEKKNCLNLKTKNPQYLLGYRLNIRKLYFMHSLHHTSGFLHSLSHFFELEMV
jgi:hypothetical protein